METKVEIFKRYPPGDRWVEVGLDERVVHPTLTSAIEHYFQKSGERQYYIDAAAGKIFKVLTEADPAPQIPRFSIYGDQ